MSFIKHIEFISMTYYAISCTLSIKRFVRKGHRITAKLKSNAVALRNQGNCNHLCFISAEDIRFRNERYLQRFNWILTSVLLKGYFPDLTMKEAGNRRSLPISIESRSISRWECNYDSVIPLIIRFCIPDKGKLFPYRPSFRPS